MNEDQAKILSNVMRSADAYAYDYATHGKLAKSRQTLEADMLAALTPSGPCPGHSDGRHVIDMLGGCYGEGCSHTEPTSYTGTARKASLQPEGQVFGIIDPDYGRVFTIARLWAWNYGYSACAQGSFTRDLDILMVPWTDQAPEKVDHIVAMIADACDLKVQGEPSVRPHGRLTWTLLFKKFGDPRFVDLSIFPAKKAPE